MPVKSNDRGIGIDEVKSVVSACRKLRCDLHSRLPRSINASEMDEEMKIRGERIRE